MEIDRFYIIFRIQELTFPNGENYIPHKFECACDENEPYSEKKPISSSMLSAFDFPAELEVFYSEELKAYRVESEKLNTSFELLSHETHKQVWKSEKFSQKIDAILKAADDKSQVRQTLDVQFNGANSLCKQQMHLQFHSKLLPILGRSRSILVHIPARIH